MKINFLKQAKHRIKIQVIKVLTDEYGGYSEIITDNFFVWAIIQPIENKEIFNNQKIENQDLKKIIIRYIEGLSSICKIKIANISYEIINIQNFDYDFEGLGQVFHVIEAKKIC